MIAEELNLSRDTFSTLSRLYPLAVRVGDPDRAKKAAHATFGVGTVVLAHDRLDGHSGFFAMVEWHLGEVVVDHMRLDDAVHEIAANKTKVAVDCGGSTAGESPRIGIVVREGGISMLKVRYPDWNNVSKVERSWKR